jgi:hypothetical protein
MSLLSTIAALYAEAAARQRPGVPGKAYKALKGGASIAALVLGQRRQLILGRQGAPVGETEITTFRRDGNVPESATRRDYRTAKGWHYVALSWDAPPTLWQMPEAELPEGL